MTTPNKIIWRFIRFLLGGTMLAPVLATAGILEFLLPTHELETITVTDMTPEGALRRTPTPDNPVYFVPISAGFRTIGGAKAGERPIAREVVNKTMLKALAKQGYLPATADHQPEIALIWSWGTLNTVRSLFLPGSTPANHRQLVRFMGGEKLGFGSRQNDGFREYDLTYGSVRGGHLDTLLDIARDDLFIAIVSAYDLDSTDSKKAELLWNTRISSPSRGFWLPEAMPAMLAMASPFIGRETEKPIWVRATDKFRPDIQLGDAKVVEYVEEASQTVVDIGPSH